MSISHEIQSSVTPRSSEQVLEQGEKQISSVADNPTATTVTELEAYYHSLYHLVSHWAAYIAMVGVLLTIGFFLCQTPIGEGLGYRRRIVGIAFIILCSLAAAVY